MAVHPATEPIDIGHGVQVWWAGLELLWKHPECRAWSRIELGGTHHRLIDLDPLTLEPSLLCPQGCGKHGFIRKGRWVPA